MRYCLTHGIIHTQKAMKSHIRNHSICKRRKKKTGNSLKRHLIKHFTTSRNARLLAARNHFAEWMNERRVTHLFLFSLYFWIALANLNKNANAFKQQYILRHSARSSKGQWYFKKCIYLKRSEESKPYLIRVNCKRLSRFIHFFSSSLFSTTRWTQKNKDWKRTDLPVIHNSEACHDFFFFSR